MFFVREATVIDTLRRLALHLRADFIEKQGEGTLELNNENGKGTVRAYHLSPGLGCLIWNITFYKEISYYKDETLMNPLYFIYILEGNVYHRFGKEEQFIKLDPLHNYVLASRQDTANSAKFGINEKVLATSIYVVKDRIKSIESPQPSYFRNVLLDVFKSIDLKSNYRHVGKMMLSQADLVRDIVSNKPDEVVGRLYMESSILNLLSQQIGAHDTSKNDISYKSPIRKKETLKVLEIGNFISKNISNDVTISRLQREFGLSPNKLQSGFKHVFGKSVHSFITDTRMEHARMLIETTDLSISEIAYSIGLSSRSNFSKLFFKRFGHLPSEYKEAIESAGACYELTYMSKAKEDITVDEIKNIYDISGQRNQELDVTGCLVFYNKEFFQILEGPKSHVLEIMSKIEQDDRHTKIEIIWEGVKGIRSFNHWRMVNLDQKEDNFAKSTTPVHRLQQELKARVKEENSNITERFWSNIRNFLLIYEN
ncbi:BLUF domain-containing protein [Aegicerativicinus sediminis]